MTLEELVAALEKWARYMAGGGSGKHLGLPGYCPYLVLSIKGDVRRRNDFVPDDIWRTDQLVRALLKVSPDLHMIIDRHYTGGEIKANAHHLNLSRRTYDRRLDNAHQALLSLYVS